MDKKMLAHLMQESLMQKAAFQIMDLYNEWPDELRVFFLITAQAMVTSLLPLLSELDRKLFDHIVGHTETTILPGTLDPRKMKGEK